MTPLIDLWRPTLSLHYFKALPVASLQDSLIVMGTDGDGLSLIVFMWHGKTLFSEVHYDLENLTGRSGDKNYPCCVNGIEPILLFAVGPGNNFTIYSLTTCFFMIATPIHRKASSVSSIETVHQSQAIIMVAWAVASLWVVSSIPAFGLVAEACVGQLL